MAIIMNCTLIINVMYAVEDCGIPPNGMPDIAKDAMNGRKKNAHARKALMNAILNAGIDQKDHGRI